MLKVPLGSIDLPLHKQMHFIVIWLLHIDLPITNALIDSLYKVQLSPTAIFSAMYSGSRSIRGGNICALDAFCIGATFELTVFDGNMGVVDAAGRLRAAGSMSTPGMMNVARNVAQKRASRRELEDYEVTI